MDFRALRVVAQSACTIEDLCRSDAPFGVFARDVAREAVHAVVERCRTMRNPSVEQIVEDDEVRQQLRRTAYRTETVSHWRAKCILFESFFSGNMADIQRKWRTVWIRQVMPARLAQRKRAEQLWTKTFDRLRVIRRFVATIRARILNRYWCDAVEQRMFSPGERGYEMARDEFESCLS